MNPINVTLFSELHEYARPGTLTLLVGPTKGYKTRALLSLLAQDYRQGTRALVVSSSYTQSGFQTQVLSILSGAPSWDIVDLRNRSSEDPLSLGAQSLSARIAPFTKLVEENQTVRFLIRTRSNLAEIERELTANPVDTLYVDDTNMLEAPSRDAPEEVLIQLRRLAERHAIPVFATVPSKGAEDFAPSGYLEESLRLADAVYQPTMDYGTLVLVPIKKREGL